VTSKKDHTITFKVNYFDYAVLKRFAEDRGITISKVIRLAVDEFLLREQEKAVKND
jgi:hypothetical protein